MRTPGKCLFCVFALAALLVAPGRIGAQSSSQSSSGGLTAQDMQVQQLVVDMYHQLSIMPSPTRVSMAAQARFQNDLAKFNIAQINNNFYAGAYQACVQDYQQAFPHVVMQSNYLMRNDSKAYNSEGAIAAPLIQAGVACVNRINTSDNFAGGADNPPSSSSTPPGQIPLYPGVPSYGGPSRPPLRGSVSNNPPLRGNANGGNPCQPFGPGGYDYCKNPKGTQPAGCVCNQPGGQPPAPSASRIPDYSPANNDIQFSQGFREGLAQCVATACSDPKTVSLLAASLIANNWKKAVRLIGIVNAISQGQSAIQLARMMQNSDPIPSSDPYTMGVYEGKRFCAWEAAWYGATSPAAGILGKPVVDPPPPPPASAGKSVSMPGGLQSILQPTGGSCSAGKPPFSVNDLLQDVSWLKAIQTTGCKPSPNCSNCVIAVANALKGKGISSAPPISCGISTGTIQQQLGGTFKYYPYSGPSSIRNTLLSQGNGAEGVVYVGNSASSHVFNFVNNKGAVRLLDGQLGKELSWQFIQSRMYQRGFTEFGVLRTN